MKFLSTIFILACAVISSIAQEPINIGSRLELFVDDYLIDELSSGARQTLHHPTPQDVAIVHDEPWEGNATNYHSIFKDGDLFRLYYKASQYTSTEGNLAARLPYTQWTKQRNSVDQFPRIHRARTILWGWS